MMKIFTTLLLIFFGCEICNAQENGFIVLRDEKGAAVVGATVHFFNTDVYAQSDAGGSVRLTKVTAGVYTMEISAIGFARIERKLVWPLSGDVQPIVLARESVQLDAVLVTAEKEEMNNQQVAASVTAFSSKDADAYRLWGSRDLKGAVSNLYAADPGDGRNVISIRGITSTSYDPAVVTYIDGVPQFTLDTYIPQLFDVDHIEVLKGPQGTLYGRNALGGVVNIVTKTPDNALHSSVEVSEGNHGQQRYTLQFSAPLIPGKLFLGVAALYEGSNGFYKNDFNNSQFDKQHRFADNISLKYILNERWSFRLNVKNLWNRNDGAFPLNASIESAFENPYHLSQDAVGKMVDNTSNGNFQLKHAGKRADFSSLTSYQSNARYYRSPVDGDFSPADIISIVNNYGSAANRVHAWTEELRIASAAGSASPLRWAVGSYLFLQQAPNKQGVHFGEDATLVGSPDSNYTIINTTKIKNQGLAFYGQAEYAVTKSFSLAGGLRYDDQESKATVSGEYIPDGAPGGFPTQNDTSGKANFHALSPMASVSFHPTEQANIYVSYHRGYRTGGLTQLSTDPSQPPLYAYQPEFSNNYELGVKTNALGNRLRANISLFYDRVNHVQVPTLILPDAITVTKNAGALTSRGAEAELQALVLKGLDLTYRFGYTHALYTRGELSSNGNSVELDGRRQVFTPDVTSMFAAQYARSLSATVHAFVRMEWFYFGRQYFDLANTQQQSAYQLLNGNIGASWKTISLSVWTRNLTSTKYVAYAYDFGAARLGDPATFGVTFKYIIH